jgi:hypothetical protein
LCHGVENLGGNLPSRRPLISCYFAVAQNALVKGVSDFLSTKVLEVSVPNEPAFQQVEPTPPVLV